MGINNYKILVNMAFDKNVLKSMYKTYSIFKEDKNFNIFKYIKLMKSMLKGEKLVKHGNQYIISPFLPPIPSQAFFTNIMAVNEKENIFTQQIYAKRSAPISMYLSLTNKCPNNCIYCSAKNREHENELSREDWIKVINDIQDMGTSIIGLTGGEPMVRDDIYDIVASIDERSVSTLFTSGFNLTLEKAKELKKQGLFSIGISLDSHDKDIHNHNRNNKNAFDYAVNAINNSRKAGIYTIAQTVILKENLNEEKMLKLFRFAKENGAHEVKILEPILSGNLLTDNKLDKILYSVEDRNKLIAIQHRANKNDNLPKITTFAYTESEEKYGCGAGNQHSYISASGDLYPCDFVPMNFGSVKKANIKDLWGELNAAMGVPKIGCLAQKVNSDLYRKSGGKLPLSKEKSLEICKACVSHNYPKYYRDLQ